MATNRCKALHNRLAFIDSQISSAFAELTALLGSGARPYADGVNPAKTAAVEMIAGWRDDWIQKFFTGTTAGQQYARVNTLTEGDFLSFIRRLEQVRDLEEFRWLIFPTPVGATVRFTGKQREKFVPLLAALLTRLAE